MRRDDLSLSLTHREALALLAALEISPFEDEVLEQKLLSLVYTAQPAHGERKRSVRRLDFTHRRRSTT